MSTPNPKVTQAEHAKRLHSAVENSCEKMRDASAFVMAVGKLMEAYVEDDVSREVMTDLVIGGLASGLLMLGTDLWEAADKAESRSATVAQEGVK
ncbi:hypothetical protein [Pseudomonas sp. MWU16-30317]|uniref:hypothetical protein n=1 Tax=Pseudomonas sp. MWU16-30317 TaxID=2878095 RepID=UPI001CF9948E|nr:hypothetical protein [Pseudomonas sp. MWU16-30317]